MPDGLGPSIIMGSSSAQSSAAQGSSCSPCCCHPPQTSAPQLANCGGPRAKARNHEAARAALPRPHPRRMARHDAPRTPRACRSDHCYPQCLPPKLQIGALAEACALPDYCPSALPWRASPGHPPAGTQSRLPRGNAGVLERGTLRAQDGRAPLAPSAYDRA
jgi:hypothetical protein